MKTIQEFKTTIQNREKQLAAVKTFLNEEGTRTLESYRKIDTIASFYDNLEELVQDNGLLFVIEQFEDCQEIKIVGYFINQKRQESRDCYE